MTKYLSALLVWTVAATAAADPIHITAGRLGTDGAASLSGREFSFAGQLLALDGRVDPLACLPCLPGDALSAGGDLTGTALAGSGAYRGADYQTGGVTSPAGFALSLTGRLVAPAQTDAALVRTPFAMTGVFWVADVAYALDGRGLASVWFTRVGSEPLWAVDRVAYDFAQPVPEPATVVLVGLGVVGLLLRRRRLLGALVLAGASLACGADSGVGPSPVLPPPAVAAPAVSAPATAPKVSVPPSHYPNTGVVPPCPPLCRASSGA